MTIHEIGPSSPRLRPERTDADKRVIGDEIRRGAVAEPVRAHAFRRLSSARATTRRRLLITTASALGTVALIVVVIVALGVTTAGTGHPSRGATKTLGTWELVSDVSPSWRALPNSAYEPTVGLPGIDLTCPTTSTCYAVDFGAAGFGGPNQIVATHDGGTTWNPVTLPVTLAGPGKPSLTCVDATTCAILGVNPSGDPTFLETTDGGQTWMTKAGPSGLTSSFSTRITCVSATNCVVISGGGTVPRSPATSIEANPQSFTTGDGGTTWSQASLPAGFLPQSLECTSVENCVAGGMSFGATPNSGGNFVYTTDGGSSWSPSSMSSGAGSFGPFSSLSCQSGGSCLTASFDFSDSSPVLNSSDDGGATWTATTATGLPQGVVMGLSCPSAGVCWATGVTTTTAMTSAVSLDNSGFAAVTTDGGSTWQDAQLPSSVAAIVAVSCPSASSCFALGVPQVNNSDNAPQPLVFLAYGTASPTN